MIEIDFYNLTFLIELIVIFGLVYQELLMKPALVGAEKTLDDILLKRNIRTVGKCPFDELEDLSQSLQNTYAELRITLGLEENHKYDTPLVSENKITKISFLPNKDTFIKYMLTISILIYLGLSLLHPYLEVKVFIASIVSKLTLYYLILCIFIYIFIIYRIFYMES